MLHRPGILRLAMIFSFRSQALLERELTVIGVVPVDHVQDVLPQLTSYLDNVDGATSAAEEMCCVRLLLTCSCLIATASVLDDDKYDCIQAVGDGTEIYCDKPVANTN